jgi:hypothetical protein
LSPVWGEPAVELCDPRETSHLVARVWGNGRGRWRSLIRDGGDRILGDKDERRRPTDRRPTVAGRRSPVPGRRSPVAGRRSPAAGRWSLVAGRWPSSADLMRSKEDHLVLGLLGVALIPRRLNVYPLGSGSPSALARHLMPPDSALPNSATPTRLPLTQATQFGPPKLGPPKLGPPKLGPPKLGPPRLGPPRLGSPSARGVSASTPPSFNFRLGCLRFSSSVAPGST